MRRGYIPNLYERTEALAQEKREEGQRKLDAAREQVRQEHSGRSGSQTFSQRGTIEALHYVPRKEESYLRFRRNGTLSRIIVPGILDLELIGFEVEFSGSINGDGKITQYSIVPVERSLRKLRYSYPSRK
jgi:hypothetical protein